MIAALGVIVALLAGPGADHRQGALAGQGCWTVPVAASVADPFREPPCRWCPGNRGIEYDVVAGRPVSAAVAGTVAFAGTVAGERYVTVDLADGRRVTYGRLDSVAVTVGQQVAAGALIGTTSDAFIFTLRDGDTYLDPAAMFGRPRARPHLIPADGSPGRHAPAVRMVCPGAA